MSKIAEMIVTTMINERLYKFSNIFSSEVDGQSPAMAALAKPLVELEVLEKLVQRKKERLESGKVQNDYCNS